MTAPRVAIVASGGANIGSVLYALERLGIKAELTASKGKIHQATHVILPGVGAAKAAMDALHKAELIDCLRQVKQPLLGICLGMQLLFEYSQEGECECLGILPGNISRLQVDASLPVPHMGWNKLEYEDGCAANNGYAYFVHSYYHAPSNLTIARTFYDQAISAIVGSDNVTGMQFHPERSGHFGHQLLQDFFTQV